ncbi:hypothetical protein ACN27J_05920 [Solwaraspora sp. WMMB762]|uniref:hypothetical protein n=1 Tax=Solwaraspora sp. WMMB762 TaxID=3404120 RepID=UPI003B927B60
MTVEHVAARPSWRCRVCRAPWPCQPAKAQLVAAYDRIGLCLYVAERSAAAALDLPGLTPAAAYARFLGWARAATRSEPTGETTMESEMTVRDADVTDIAELSALLAEAFVTNPVAGWLIADVSTRYTTFLRLFDVELTHGLRHGVVHVAGNREGVAVWQPYPMRLTTVTDHEREVLGAAGIYRRRVAHLRAVRDEHRAAALRLPVGPSASLSARSPVGSAGPAGGSAPEPVVGHELVYLAAAPWLRRRRIGAALLDHHQRTLDAAGLVGHTVTDEEYARDLLAVRGWRTPGPRHLSPGGPPLWSMRRDPGTRPIPPTAGYGR